MNPWEELPINPPKSEQAHARTVSTSRWANCVGVVAFFASLVGFLVVNLPESFGVCLFFTGVAAIALVTFLFPWTKTGVYIDNDKNT